MFQGTSDDRVDVDDLPPLGTEDEFDAMLLELGTTFAPRRFALFAVQGIRADAALVAWGTAFDDTATLCWPDGRPAGRFRSAESAGALFARLGEIRLVWLDAVQPDSCSDSERLVRTSI